MSRLSLSAVLIILVSLAMAGLAPAQTIELAPIMDATLYEDAGGVLANGSGSYLFVGRTAQPLTRRALIAFDIAGAIPAGSTIITAELKIEVSKVSDPSDQTVFVHRVTESWGEGASDAPGQEGSGAPASPGDATWIHRSYPADPWTTAGGSFVPAASAQRAIGSIGSYSFNSTPQLVSDVQAWLDDPSGNFGWILLMTSTTNGTAKRFDSRENATANARPKLEIQYQASTQAPVANFSWSPQSPSAGQPVQFSDMSTGSPTAWAWDFGDGSGSSAAQNPSYTYGVAGTYNVTLVATNGNGNDTVTKQVMVSSGAALDTLYYLPAAAKSAGAQGSFFITDLDIQNGDANTATYQLLWLPRGADNSTPEASASFNLAAGAAVRYSDVLGEVFGFDDGAVGALAIASDSRDLTLMSRTYNSPPAGGTFGQAIPGYRGDQLIVEGERRRILFFTENGEFRSNLGLLNGTDQPTRVMWERFLPDGSSLGTGQADLPPWGNVQLNRIFADSQPVRAAYIEVWTSTTGGAFAAYGSVLDNESSDPTTVLPQ
ncbi:MAG TPA: DNRLRE domain-containing protein [Thermoanaerobaculales bacterium]|nr:DNRLRE domain-containing protein [Thermoanaerobaculales bacterium]HQL29559.1 DNRLRE domain-containing protein [Thermoanaerobaculales bacterium]HQN97376.1 DNRLRE domain-containing protein [Thermoanaerobaculales bacterium]HQP43761.1 DNRLRE domain-containing protein [Thermoanaerobaculales bacterium]